MLHDPQSQLDSTSPALLTGPGAADAFELKFLVNLDTAASIERWADARLTIDPHADAALGNAYRIHSFYLDTPALDIFHGTPTFRRRKFRLRRYGAEGGVFLERKTKSAQRVRKRRTPIGDGEMDRLLAPAADPTWPGAWFHELMLTRRLQPACQITYDRIALIGASAEGPLRLTLDRRIHAAPTQSWRVTAPTDAVQLIPDQVVLELKYRDFVPQLFKQLIAEFRLNPRPASKYRLAMATWGAAADSPARASVPAVMLARATDPKEPLPEAG